VSTRLAHQTQKTAGIGNGMRTATIAAVSGSVVTLSVNGGLFSSGVGVIGSYAPVVGDVVAVFRQDSSWLVLGPMGIDGFTPKDTIAGTTPVSFTTLNNFSQPVTFGGLAFPVAPAIMVNIDSGAGATARVWLARAIAVTTVGFTIFVFSSDSSNSTWSSIPVSWTATAK
jgi:hypothetical protein